MNEINFIKISPVNLIFKNNSIQASLSKDYSLIRSKGDIFNLQKINETMNNISNNINNHFNNQNSSSSSGKEQSFEVLKERMFSAGLKTGFNYKVFMKNKNLKNYKILPKKINLF